DETVIEYTQACSCRQPMTIEFFPSYHLHASLINCFFPVMAEPFHALPIAGGRPLLNAGAGRRADVGPAPRTGLGGPAEDDPGGEVGKACGVAMLRTLEPADESARIAPGGARPVAPVFGDSSISTIGYGRAELEPWWVAATIVETEGHHVDPDDVD